MAKNVATTFPLDLELQSKDASAFKEAVAQSKTFRLGNLQYRFLVMMPGAVADPKGEGGCPHGPTRSLCLTHNHSPQELRRCQEEREEGPKSVRPVHHPLSTFHYGRMQREEVNYSTFPSPG